MSFIEQFLSAEILDCSHAGFSNPIVAHNHIKGLKATIGLLRLSSTALLNVHKLQLNHFDGLVGDCACQIRAIETAVFARQLTQLEDPFKAHIKKLEGRLSQLNIGMTLRTSLRELLSEVPFTLMNNDLQILILSHMLHQVKIEKKITLPCPAIGCKDKGQDLKDFTEGGKLFRQLGQLSNDIVDAAQSLLATMSCIRLVELVKEHHLPLQRTLNEGVLETVSRPGGRARLELPCFLSIEAALELAANAQIPVLIKSKKTDHSFEESSTEPFDVQILCESTINKDGDASLKLFKAIPKNQTILVIEGFRARCKVGNESSDAYKDRLEKEDLAHLIRINAAAHFQCTTGKTGKEEERRHLSEKGFPDFAEHLRALDNEAQERGCTIENPSLFVVLHIHASTLAEQGITTGGAS